MWPTTRAGGRNSGGELRTGPHKLAPHRPHESQRTGTRYSTQPTTRELQPTPRRATAMLAAGPRCTASLVGPAAWTNQRPTPRCRCCKAVAGGSRNVAVRSTTPLGLHRTNQRGWGLGYANLPGLPKIHRVRHSGPGILRDKPSVKHPGLLPRVTPAIPGARPLNLCRRPGRGPATRNAPCNQIVIILEFWNVFGCNVTHIVTPTAPSWTRTSSIAKHVLSAAQDIFEPLLYFIS